MPLSTTLEALHEAIQMTMGWTFSHLLEFEIDGRSYGDPSFREFDDEPVICKAKGLRPGTAIARGADWFVYVYDYGDNWRHNVIVEEVRDGDPDVEYPIFVDGAGVVRRRMSAGRTASWTFCKRSWIRRTTSTGRCSTGTAGRSIRSGSTKRGPISALRTWRGVGAVRSPATGAGSGDPSGEPGATRIGPKRGRAHPG